MAVLLSSRRLRGLLLAMILLVFIPWPGSTASADCAAPYLQIADSEDKPVVVQGTTISVQGRAFVVGCDDMGDSGGCSGDREEEVPIKNVELSLRQGTQRWDFSTEDAGVAADSKLGQINWDLQVPPQAKPGRATLVAGDARLAVTVQSAK